MKCPSLLIIGLILCLTVDLGCGGRPVESQIKINTKQKETSTPPPVAPVEQQAKPTQQTAQSPSVVPKIPKVKLTDALMATCLVKVGQPMPNDELADLEGNVQSFKAFYGDNLTVIFFWSSKNMYALAELKDLANDVAKPFKDRGVRIIAINVGDPPDVVRREAEKAKTTFTILVDPRGEYFGQIATNRIPRTYIIGPTGKIIWFDVEYSRSTRRDLLQTIDAVLGQKQKHKLSSHKSDTQTDPRK